MPLNWPDWERGFLEELETLVSALIFTFYNIAPDVFLQVKLSVQDSTLARLQGALRETEEQVCSLRDTVAQQRDDLHAGEMERRRLHNTIQELKVNGC